MHDFMNVAASLHICLGVGGSVWISVHDIILARSCIDVAQDRGKRFVADGLEILCSTYMTNRVGANLCS